MGWYYRTDFDSSADDHRFAAPKQRSTGKNSPTNEWLCKNLDRLNLTLMEGYHSKSSEASGLQFDQFFKTPRSQINWYGLHSDRQHLPVQCPTVTMIQSVLIALIAGSPDLEACRPLHQHPDPSPKKPWGSGRRQRKNPIAFVIKPQGCLSSDSMQTQLKIIQGDENKGKPSNKCQNATDWTTVPYGL